MPSDSDRFEVPEEPPGRRERGTWLLRQAVRALHGDPGEYEEITEVVRRDLDEVQEAASRWLTASEAEPMLRWSILHVIGDAGDERTLDLLRRQALRTVPLPRRQPGVCEDPAELEELVVIRAIGALGSLARRQVLGAVDALHEVLERQDRRAFRRPAVAHLLAVDPDQRRTVAERLPEEDRYLVDLRAAAADDVTVSSPEEEPTQRSKREPGRKLKLDRAPRMSEEGGKQ
jgi:HEAT repeat protein